MSRISVDGRVAVLGVRGEGNLEASHKRGVPQGSEISSQQMRGVISGEMPGGICRRYPQRDLGLSGSCRELQTDLFDSKN